MHEKNNFINKIFSLQLPLKERIFIFMRFISAPFVEIENLIPQKANILDIGCGHGLLELVLKNKNNQRLITGIDPDKNKIKFAKKLEQSLNLKNLNFYNCSVFDVKEINKFDYVIIFDVDYLLENEEKTKFLKKIRKLLNKNGILVIKTVIKKKSIGYYLSYLQELFTVYLFKKTFTGSSQFHFLTIEEYKRILKNNNYKVIKDGKLKTKFYHPHYYFIAKK